MIIAAKLANMLRRVAGLFGILGVKKFYEDKGVIADVFELERVTEDIVWKALNSAKPDKSTGLDKIPAHFIQDSAE